MSEKNFTIKDLVEVLGEEYSVIGKQDSNFNKPMPLNESDENSISFYSYGPERIDLLTDSRANHIIVGKTVSGILPGNSGKTYIVVDNPRLSFARVVRALFDNHPRVGIHRSAVIGNDCQIGPSVFIGPGVTIGDNVNIGEGSQIFDGVHIYDKTRIGRNVIIHSGAVIGMDGYSFIRNLKGELEKFPQLGNVEIGDGVEIGSCSCIARATMTSTRIGKNTKVDNLVHVAHNVVIGSDCLIIAHAMIGGNVKIGDRTWIAPCACIRDNISIGSDVMVGMGSVVTKSVPDGVTVFGVPAKLKQN